MQATHSNDIAKLAPRPESFSGDASYWPDWSFKLHAYLAVLSPHIADVAAHAEIATSEILLADVDPSQQGNCHGLYLILATTLEGSALALAKSVEKGNGAELWRRLKAKYEPAAATRTMALLQRITSPTFTAGRIADDLQDWENVVQEYERCSGTSIRDDLKMAIVAQHCPDAALKSMLMMSTAPTYAAQKEIVQNYARSVEAMGSAAPMDISAVSRGRQERTCFVCRKPGHIAKDCKGGGKGSDKGALVLCQLCDKPGHTAKECPSHGANAVIEEDAANMIEWIM